MNRKPFAAAAAVAVAAGTAGLLAGVVRAGAQSDVPPFSATAEAVGMRLSGSGQNAPATNDFLDAGAPLARAHLDSLGGSTALASEPYPGDAVIAGPGLVAGFSNGKVTPPEYPFVVQSRYPAVPEQRRSQPGLGELAATSGVDASHATGIAGVPSPRTDQFVASGANTEAGVEVDGDAVVARSSSLLQGLVFGPLRIAQVQSSAGVVRHGEGAYTPTTTLEVVGATIGDQHLMVTEQGLVLGDQKAGVPAPPSEATQNLEAQGVSIRYLTGFAAGPAATSPALLVSWVRVVPGSPVSPVTLSVVIGRSSAGFVDAGSGADIGVPASGAGPVPPETPPVAAGAAADAVPVASPTVAPVAPVAPPGAGLPSPVGWSAGSAPVSSAAATGFSLETAPPAALSVTETSGGSAALALSPAGAGKAVALTGALAVMMLAVLVGTGALGLLVVRR